PFFHDLRRRYFLYLVEQRKIIPVGHKHTQPRLFGEPRYPQGRITEVVFDLLFDPLLRHSRQTYGIDPREIAPLQLPMVGAEVAQKVDLLKAGPKPSRIRTKLVIQEPVTFAKDPQTHKPHHLGAAIDVSNIAVSVIFFL